MKIHGTAPPPQAHLDPRSLARRNEFQSAHGRHYDVAIIGAGISGSRTFHELRRHGHRVLLIDRGDFACGTTQASGMMVWGGLLYLKDLDFSTVRKLSRARDSLIEQLPDQVRTECLRYLPGKKSLRNRHIVHAGMMLYWLIGSLKRRFPQFQPDFPELVILAKNHFRGSLSFEEAVLKTSDCRFSLEWILPFLDSHGTALNHCASSAITFDAGTRTWRLDLLDRLHGHEATATVRFIVNAAGVWTDHVNNSLGIESPYRHELSKGVYLSIRRPKALHKILIFDTGENGDTLTLSPWGPVALCGPTETRVTQIHEGFQPTPDDVRSLLKSVNTNLKHRCEAEDIVSLRCGIRPLAVNRGFSKIVHPLELSRRHLVHHDRSRNAIAIYGGKLTSCGDMAEQVRSLLQPELPRRQPTSPRVLESPAMEAFPGIASPVHGAAWCRDHEHCHTLQDYLRRRTNIAQWIPRGGLGKHSEHLEALRAIAQVFSSEPKVDLADYQALVSERHDAILSKI